jgi:Asp-tRNA(Asn)/Glu-tRNA(Gln) amidotransferase A subunit family amidase
VTIALGDDRGDLWSVSAAELLSRLRRGTATSGMITKVCLGRIAEREDAVHAWQFLDETLALRQAEARDAASIQGPLHGIPVGVKDLIDTTDMPTAYGSPLYSDHRPTADATCIVRIKRAGGLIMGKTVTTEFAAVYEPAKTRNPFDPTRTPGGSSSGSAAAVADGMVPLALGTQTGGSVLRPASFCGIFGYKPTFGAISRAGIKPVSPSLDTVGLFARSIEDIGRLAEILVGPDPLDAATEIPAIDLELRHEPTDSAPRIAYVRTPWLDEAEPYVLQSLDALAQRLAAAGARVAVITLPEHFGGLVEAATLVMDVEAARELGPDYDRAPLAVGRGVAKIVESGRARKPTDYARALRLQKSCRDELNELLRAFDVALLPVATGEAPAFASTGDPIFCRPWTLLGSPALSVPGLRGPTGLPLGFQLLGKHYADGELLRAASWIATNAPSPKPGAPRWGVSSGSR